MQFKNAIIAIAERNRNGDEYRSESGKIREGCRGNDGADRSILCSKMLWHCSLESTNECRKN